MTSNNTRFLATRPVGAFCTLCALTVTAALAFAGAAVAGTQVIDYFGGASGASSLGGEFKNPGKIAVNQSGAGPADRGDVYVVDGGNDRIQRFRRDDSGTPAEPFDDTYAFVSAWGADVDATPAGGSDYETCTVAAECKAGVGSTGNGALDLPSNAGSGIAVDQDTGEVYVSDTGNNRVNVYDGAGTFLRAFGYDVVASGPGQVAGPDERQQLTVKASGGKFSLTFEGRSTGARGSAPLTKGSDVVKKVQTTDGAFAVGQAFAAFHQAFAEGKSAFPLGTTITAVGAEELTLSQTASFGTNVNFSVALVADDLDFDAPAAQLQAALNALPSIGGVGGSVTVTGGPGDETGSTPYLVDFGGSLAGEDVPLLDSSIKGLIGGTPAVEASEIAKGGAFEVCVAADGDICKDGSASDGVGGVDGGMGIAVSPPDGNPATGTVFLADTGNSRVGTYSLDGTSPSSFGSGVFQDQSVPGWEEPKNVAVDSRGIVYASNIDTTPLGALEAQYVERYDTQDANGEGVGFLAPIADPPLLSFSSPTIRGLAVDADSDGAGPDLDALYVLHQSDAKVQQFGPTNAPGLAAPPAAVDDEHGGAIALFNPGDVAVDEADQRLYVSAQGFKDFTPHGVYLFGPPGGAPSASVDSVSDLTATSATVHATVNPNGPPALKYRLEYSLDGAEWASTPETALGSQETPQALEIAIDPPGAGLQPSTEYRVRLVVKKGFDPPSTTPELSFETLPESPIAETTGAPVRTATTAQLSGRLNPRNSATTYRFEYGDQGPCGANPCASTPSLSAGSGGTSQLVSEEVADLAPGTTYHYRLVADNGAPGSPSSGGDMQVTTRASDAPLSHGSLPGPPGSDRAYEQVNVPDTGGNPVGSALGFSADGNRAVYTIAGGTPLSDTGSLLSLYFAERTAGGWQTKAVAPPRAGLVGPSWFPPVGRRDLSSLVAVNATGAQDDFAVWRLTPGGQPTMLFEHNPPLHYEQWAAIGNDSERTVLLLRGPADPSHPEAAPVENLYDVTSGAPKLTSVMPDGKAPACGIPAGSTSAFVIGVNTSHQWEGWVSDDGSRAFFLTDGHGCSGQPQLYLRDFAVAETRLVSGPPTSGPACRVAFIRAIPDAVFFWTHTRIAPEDTAPASCSGDGDGDVYRYDLDEGKAECVTCVVPGLDADVPIDENAFGAQRSVAVAGDGSRVYFQSGAVEPLLPGASAAPTGSTYRVDLGSGELRWIGSGIVPGNSVGGDNAISPDGSVLVFRSSDPALNPLGGSDNGGEEQYYRYDDDDRSLTCISCPQDGAPAMAGASGDLLSSFLERQVGPNLAFVADDGTVAFATPTPLVGADQNTPGPGEPLDSGEDVYEWRDGKVLLVTDGLTSWTARPTLQGISPSGRDVYFTATAEYTADAPDAYNRLYDARIGGGFEFAKPPPPCPLEVCQGTPRGAPEEPLPSSASYRGQGNVAKAPARRRCGKGKVRRKKRCVSRKKVKRAQRRAHRRGGRGR